MESDPQKYHRRSTRLQSWDYSWPWWYYVTITTKDKICSFGNIVNDGVQLSPVGKAVQHCWLEIRNHNQNVELDEYIVMPNHLHGIVIIGEQHEEGFRRDVQLNVPTERLSEISPKKGSLSVVVRTFKAAVTTWAHGNGYSDFAWTGRFHDHIIRNEADLARIRQYIHNNPLQWVLDEENPRGL